MVQKNVWTNSFGIAERSFERSRLHEKGYTIAGNAAWGNPCSPIQKRCPPRLSLIHIYNGKPPYLAIHLKDRVVILNGKTPEETRQYHRLLTQAATENREE